MMLVFLISGCGGRIDDGSVVSSATRSSPPHELTCESAIYLLGIPDAPDPPQLLALSPITLAIKTIGPVACGGIPREAFSMAVSSDTAYVEWVDYATQATDVFRVRLKDAMCSSSVHMKRPAFEMTFAKGQLFLSDVHHLYAADADTLATTLIAPLPHLGRAPLTATSDGRLYAMFPTGELSQLDPTSGRVIDSVPIRDPGTFALAYFDGEIFLFADKLLERYRDGVLRTITKMPTSIVARGHHADESMTRRAPSGRLRRASIVRTRSITRPPLIRIRRSASNKHSCANGYGVGSVSTKRRARSG